MSLSKLDGRATTLGQEFEFKLAALLFVRLKQRPELRFELATNVAGADPCDDVLLRLYCNDGDNAPSCITYLVQLKHGQTPKEYKSNPFSEKKGKYSACTYFEVYKTLADEFKKIKGISDENKKYLTLYKADTFRFIVLTNNTFKYIPTQPQNIQGQSSNIPDTSRSINPINNPHLEELFPHCDLLSSAEGNYGYSFSKNDQSVWNLFNEDILEKEYREVFLKHFRIFSGQPSSTDFEKIIARELKTLFQLGDAQNHRILREYLRRCKDWWESDRGDIWTNETPVLEEILIEDINCKFQDALSEHCFSKIRFSDESREDLAQRIRCHRISVASTPGVHPQVRCSKLLQVFDSKFGNNVLLLDSKTLRSINYAVKALLRNISLGSNSVILINILDAERNILQMVQKICQDAQGKVVITCSSPEEIAGILTEKIARIEDKWSMDQLDLDDQSNLLEEKVNFQGRHVILRELETTWPTLRQDVDGPFLCALAEGSAILGDSLTPLNVDPLYLPRIIEHRSELKREVLFLNTGKDRFVLSGFSESLLLELQAERQNRKINDDRWHILSSYDAYFKNPERDREIFLNICKRFPENHIHHIVFCENSFLWIDSRGSHEHVIPFFIQRSSTCNEGPQICQHDEDSTDFSHWNERTFYLSGGPGIGKSTFLSHLSKRGSDVHWHIFIPLAHFTWLWKNLCENDGIVRAYHVIQLFSEAVNAESCSSPRTTKAFLENSLLVMGNLRVFVDGVDEICPGYKLVALDLIKFLIASRTGQVWVSSRNHLEHDLRRLFKYEPLHLRPFSEEEQIDYICRFVSCADGQVDADELRGSVREVVEFVKQSTTRQGRFISEVPLHTYLLARAYRNHQAVLQRAIQGTVLLLVKLYQIFISENISIYIKKLKINPESANFKSIKSKIVRIHEECALSFLGFENFLHDDCVQNHIRDNEEDNTGILYFSKTGAVFVHHSFVEYFYANWMMSNAEKITTEMWESMSHLSRYFFNALLACDCKLHEAIIGGNIEQIESEIGRIKELDRKGRTALHLASIEGNIEACHLLLQAGVETSVEDKVLNWTALRYADSAVDMAVIDVLLGAGGRKQDVKKLVWKNVENKGTVFRTAAIKGYLNIINLFEAVKSDSIVPEDQKMYFSSTGTSDIWKQTPLHLSSSWGQPSIVEYFINNGGSVNGSDDQDFSPLHLAVEYGHANVVELLVRAGATVNVADAIANTPLFYSCSKGHQDIVELLLREGALVNTVNKKGESPLHYASTRSNQDIVKLLLGKGASINAVNKEGKSPLHYSCWRGCEGVVKLLLDEGALVNASGEDGVTPLHSACYQEYEGIVKLLLGIGALANAVSKDGHTPLHYTCMKDHQGIVDLLLVEGATVNVFNKEGVSPLHYACKAGNRAIVELLLSKDASVEIVNEEGKSPFHYACMGNHQGIVELLLERGPSVNDLNKDGYSPFHYACMGRNYGIVELLLAKGALVNAVSGDEYSPLHYACKGGEHSIVELILSKDAFVNAVNGKGITPLHYACRAGNKDIVELLLGKGASVDAVSRDGYSLLHYACRKGNKCIVELLLDKGASVNAANVEGTSSLHYGCMVASEGIVDLLVSKGASVNALNKQRKSPLHYACMKDHKSNVEVLLGKGALVNAVSEDGYSPLHYACKRGNEDIVKLLLCKGALVDSVNEEGTSPLHHGCMAANPCIVKLLLDQGALVNAVNKERKSPLHYACMRGLKSNVQLLVDTGASVNDVSVDGYSPLHYACQGGNRGIVELLIGKGASVNSVSKEGHSPLHYACRRGDEGVVKLFLSEGASVNVVDKAGESPLHFACMGGHHDVVKVLFCSGVVVNDVDERGVSSLHFASGVGNRVTVDMLLSEGSRINATDKEGKSPLHYACKGEHKDIVTLLVANGGSVNTVDTAGDCPLHYVCRWNDKRQGNRLGPRSALVNAPNEHEIALLSAVLTRTRRNPEEDAWKVIALFLQKGADARIRNSRGQTPLDLARLFENTHIIRLLQQHASSSTSEASPE